MSTYGPNPGRSYNYSYNARTSYDQERGYSPANAQQIPPKRKFGDLSNMSQSNRTMLYCGAACCCLILVAIIALILIIIFANGVDYGWTRPGSSWFGGGYGGGYGGGGYGGGRGGGYGGYGK